MDPDFNGIQPGCIRDTVSIVINGKIEVVIPGGESRVQHFKGGRDLKGRNLNKRVDAGLPTVWEYIAIPVKRRVEGCVGGNPPVSLFDGPIARIEAYGYGKRGFVRDGYRSAFSVGPDIRHRSIRTIRKRGRFRVIW